MSMAVHTLAASRTERWMRMGALVSVALLALGVYANSMGNGFALDDVGIITNHPTVQQHEWLRLWTENYWPCPEGAPDLLYRPLTIFSYVLNHALVGDVTWSYHAVNVALHMLVSVMVTLLAGRLLGNWKAAAIAGVLFALHPLHTEVVANVVGRAELLAATWTLAALLVYLPRADVLAGVPAHRSWWHGWLVGACMFLAILSKETPVVMLAAFVFIDLWRWSHWNERPSLGRWLSGRTLRYYLPLGVVAAVYGAMRVNAVGWGGNTLMTHPVVNPLVDATILERIVTPFMLLGKYLSLLVWPARLSSDYSAPSLMPTTNLLNPGVLMGMMLAGLGLLVVASRWRRWPRVVVLIVLFALSYALVANFLRIGTIFGERLFYWPSVFVLMLAGYMLALGWDFAGTLPTRVYLRVAGSVAMAGLCVAMSVRTMVRNTDWEDNIHLAIATARDNPGSAKACYWAGAVLAAEAPKPEWVAIGVGLLKDAVEMRPDFGSAYFELAKYYGRRQEFNESFLWLCRAARWEGGMSDIRMALRQVRADLQQRDADGYMPAIEAYLKEHEKDPSGYLALGMAHAARGNLAEADAAFMHGLDMDANFIEMRFEFGVLRQRQGDLVGAMHNLRIYNMTVKYNVEARLDLARVLMSMDHKTYPFAIGEAGMNLTKAEAMFYADSRVRTCRAEWLCRSVAIEAEETLPPPPAAKSRSDDHQVQSANPLIPLGMAN